MLDAVEINAPLDVMRSFSEPAVSNTNVPCVPSCAMNFTPALLLVFWKQDTPNPVPTPPNLACNPLLVPLTCSLAVGASNPRPKAPVSLSILTTLLTVALAPLAI